MMLVAAARRRCELVPGRVLRAIGHPAVALAVGTLFLAGAFLQALVIRDGLVERRAAAAIAVAIVAVSVAAWRRGAFRPRTVIELRREPERDLGRMTVTAAGRPSPAAVAFGGLPHRGGAFECFSDLATATVMLPPGGPDELEAWVHRITRDGDSEPIPAMVTRDGSTNRMSPTHA